jgi:hypothetical protein
MLAGGALASKTTSEGVDTRLALLEDQSALHHKVSECVDERRDGAAWHDRISKGRLDDVLDAAVLAYTAAELELGSRSAGRSYPAFPTGESEHDQKLELPMEIVHPEQDD